MLPVAALEILGRGNRDFPTSSKSPSFVLPPPHPPLISFIFHPSFVLFHKAKNFLQEKDYCIKYSEKIEKAQKILQNGDTPHRGGRW